MLRGRLLGKGRDSLIANKEITDTAGCTHYFRNCAYLFSIRKNGKDIGSITDGSLKMGVVVGPAYGSNQAVNLSDAQLNVGGSSFYALTSIGSLTPAVA